MGTKESLYCRQKRSLIEVMNMRQRCNAQLELAALAILLLSCMVACKSDRAAREEIDKAIPLVASATSWHQFQINQVETAETDVVCPSSYASVAMKGSHDL